MSPLRCNLALTDFSQMVAIVLSQMLEATYLSPWPQNEKHGPGLLWKRQLPAPPWKLFVVAVAANWPGNKVATIPSALPKGTLLKRYIVILWRVILLLLLLNLHRCNELQTNCKWARTNLEEFTQDVLQIGPTWKAANWTALKRCQHANKTGSNNCRNLRVLF